MTKKLIFALVVLIAVIVVALKLRQTDNLLEATLDNKAAISTNASTLLQKDNLGSIAILAHNDEANIREADKLIAELNHQQKIKVLSFEIYEHNTPIERLLEIAQANGKPDFFYVNGTLVEPENLAEFIRNKQEQTNAQ